MKFDISYSPSFAMATARLESDESVVAESGAMVSMSDNISIQTSSRQGRSGGVFKALKRAALAGESFFLNTYTAAGGPGEVTFAPALPGDITTIPMTGGSVIVQSTSFLAGSAGVNIDSKWGGFKTFFGGEGFFMIKATGQGEMAVNSFGAIHELELNGPYVVDTGHIVAFQETLGFKVQRVGSWKSTFFSGEGLVCLFDGQGKLWIQSRNPGAFGKAIGSKLPPRES
ncbi:MAG: TIGR00266 family protein [bacterium]